MHAGDGAVCRHCDGDLRGGPALGCTDRLPRRADLRYGRPERSALRLSERAGDVWGAVHRRGRGSGQQRPRWEHLQPAGGGCGDVLGWRVRILLQRWACPLQRHLRRSHGRPGQLRRLRHHVQSTAGERHRRVRRVGMHRRLRPGLHALRRLVRRYRGRRGQLRRLRLRLPADRQHHRRVRCGGVHGRELSAQLHRLQRPLLRRPEGHEQLRHVRQHLLRAGGERQRHVRGGTVLRRL